MTATQELHVARIAASIRKIRVASNNPESLDSTIETYAGICEYYVGSAGGFDHAGFVASCK
jgi:hypothetical protein